MTLSAPTSGDYEDILFYQDANTPSDFTAVFNGGANMELNGVLYFPSTTVKFAGNGDPGGATSIVARTVFFTGNANLGSNPSTKTFGPGGAGEIVSCNDRPIKIPRDEMDDTTRSDRCVYCKSRTM